MYKLYIQTTMLHTMTEANEYELRTRTRTSTNQTISSDAIKHKNTFICLIICVFISYGDIRNVQKS